MLALKPDCNHHYSRNRIHRQDGSYYDVVEATALIRVRWSSIKVLAPAEILNSMT